MFLTIYGVEKSQCDHSKCDRRYNSVRKFFPQNHMVYTVYIIVLNTNNWGDSVGHQIPLIETIEGLAWGRETVQIPATA